MTKKQNQTPIVEYERKLSPVRVMSAMFLFGGLCYSLFTNVNSWHISKSVSEVEPWFAAYVDVTATPYYQFEQLGETSTPHAVLSFIVSSQDDPCIPTWGSFYTLEEAASALDLDRRIARLQQLEGRIAVSFGGAINDELGFACTDHDRLVSAYQAVVDRYNIDTIDLDLENQSLFDQEATTRRAKAIGQLQQQRRNEGKGLAVWVTLPVAPQGLTEDGTNAVAALLSEGVDIAGVNVMTMNYGESKADGDSMFEASKRALIETHRQLGILYQQQGIHLNSATLWKKIGATPMIGQNDVADEVFTLEDAVALNQFALDKEIARMSLWSANRDISCGDNYVDRHIVSDACSGVPGDQFEFVETLSNGFDGDFAQNSTLVTTDDPEDTVQIADDPATSPYQIWQESGTYLAETKVVWHGNVYEAKWWTQGDLPDHPVLQSWETAWQLIGPVLPGETPIPLPTLPPGTYQTWSGSQIYQVGDRVLYENIPFEAKWWSQGQSPAASKANQENSPWKPLSSEQIKAVLEQN